MAVKIERIDDLEALGKQIKIYGDSIKDAADDAHQNILNVLEGSEGEAIEALRDVLIGLKNRIFQNIPGLMTAFSDASLTYHTVLKGVGFNNIIKSTKPEVEENYCRRIEKEQLPQAIDEATRIKQIVNEVSYLLATVPTSLMDTHITKFESELLSVTSDIKRTRQTVQEAQTLFKQQMKEATTGLSDCEKELDKLMDFKDPTTGLSERQLVLLIRSGLITGDNIESLVSTTTSADREALAYLSEGDYEKLFSMDPKSLQDSTYGLMLEHIENHMENPVEIEKLVNGLFGQSDVDAEVRVENFLIKFSEQSALQMNQMGMILMLDDSDAALMERYNRMKQLDVLFETLYVVNPVKYTKGWEPNDAQKQYGASSLSWSESGKISGLTFNSDGRISFDLATYRSTGGITGTIDDSEISSVRYDSKYDFTEASENKRLAEIRKEKSEYLIKVMEEGLMTTIGIFQPELAVTIGIIQSIKESSKASSNIKTAEGMQSILDKGITDYNKDKFEGNPEGFKAWKEGYSKKTSAIGNVVTVATNISVLAEGWNDLNSKELREKQNRLYSILDIGGTEVSKAGDTIYAACTPVDHLSYKQQMRLSELYGNGYQSFLQTLGSDESKVREALGEVKLLDGTIQFDETAPNAEERKLILYGGDPLKTDTDQIEKVLKGAIDTTKLSPEVKDTFIDDANDWFKSDGGYMDSFN